MTDSITLRLPDAEFTHSAGASLARTLPAVPVTVWLTGELGAGKTTFLQGLASALGIRDRLTSPTFALEQRYQTADGTPLIHIDLYRLAGADAERLLHASEEHTGIRCVEWADRLPSFSGGIHVHLAEGEERTTRKLIVTFADFPIPTEAEIETWRDEMALPVIIRRHCDAVAQTADRLGERKRAQGCLLRPAALHAAARLHDLLRPVDFRQGAAHIEEEISPERAARWKNLRTTYAGMKHEAAAAAFLEERGFPGIADIVRTHGLTLSASTRVTIEQQILYYADKRVKIDEVVSLEERLRDFTARYAPNGVLPAAENWYEEARQTEHELFPNGVPF
ncbi:MAG: tRNA (adenosine(37)-N6)-threonylcarbamoyltransferase complex ATPase subunit type 1 TsaE [Candidatus Peribacteraceae bacterium]|nr:tRNA (adenosine(37)-N6)-threonylcarbamoyltransferase complex ATPase subunit type 1 TsaE [Candidatus Peribacteraceae bacterium]